MLWCLSFYLCCFLSLSFPLRHRYINTEKIYFINTECVYIHTVNKRRICPLAKYKQKRLCRNVIASYQLDLTLTILYSSKVVLRKNYNQKRITLFKNMCFTIISTPAFSTLVLRPLVLACRCTFSEIMWYLPC